MAQGAYTQKRIVVERRGKPMVAIVSVEDLARLEGIKLDQAMIHQPQMAMLERARALRKKIKQRNLPATDVVEDINRLREDRPHELSGLR
jgi:PHD/YefM family antitoxin component YafN of YafNO toxin-antitoxin module